MPKKSLCCRRSFLPSRVLVSSALFLALASEIMAVDYKHCITCEDVERQDGTTTDITICCQHLKNCLLTCENKGGDVPGVKTDPNQSITVDIGAYDLADFTAVQAAPLIQDEPSWTPWLNRDSEGGTGDFETLKDFIGQGQACSDPIDIECQTDDGIDWKQTGQEYTCDKKKGGICKNNDQLSGKRCENYRVRFLCPTQGSVQNLRMVNYLCSVAVVSDQGGKEVVRHEGTCCEGWLCLGRDSCGGVAELCGGIKGVFNTW